jgi:hypothetical protein
MYQIVHVFKEVSINNTHEAYVYKIIKTRLRNDALVCCTYSINALVFSHLFLTAELFYVFVFAPVLSINSFVVYIIKDVTFSW